MHWIKVSEKKPPDKGPYLFYLEDGTQAVAQIKSQYDKYYSTGGWEHCSMCDGTSTIELSVTLEKCIHSKTATHWMELPKKPEDT